MDRNFSYELNAQISIIKIVRHDPVEIIKRYKELLNKFIEI